MNKLSIFGSSLLLSIAVVACGPSFPVPQERLSQAEAASRTAKELDADSVPQAALYLKLANEEIERAKTQIKNEDNHTADMTLQRASADAELSVQLAKGAKAKNDAQAAQDRAAQVRQGK